MTTPLLDHPAAVRRSAGLVRVTGSDRRGYLHTLLSQHFEESPAGTAADFLYLDAKGNPLAAGRALVLDEEVWLLTPRDVAGDLAAALEKFKFLMDVTAVDASDDIAMASIRGPGDIAVDEAPREPLRCAAVGDGVLVRDRHGGVDLVGPPGWVEERLADAGVGETDEAAWEAWRINAGEPGWSSEIAGGRRAQELGLLPTHVHLTKGCYPGQESIAKTYNLGNPRRALAVLDAEGDVAVGDEVHAEGARRPGEVTSAARAGDRWVALALVPLDREGVAPETVTVGEVPARVRYRVGAGLPQPGA